MTKNTSLLLIATLFLLPLHARQHSGRFDKLIEQQETPAEEPSSEGATFTPCERTEHFTEQETDDHEPDATAIPDDFEEEISVSASDTPQGPVSTICSNLARRCTFVADRLMTQSPQQTNRQMLKLFCNVLFLMSDLADTDLEGLREGNTIPVRADAYNCKLIAIVATIKETVALDPSLADISYRYPVLGSLIRSTTRSGLSNADDARTELGMAMYHLLRAPSSGKTLVQELFSELSDIGHNKAEHLMAVFHDDLENLLNLTEKPLETEYLTRSPEELSIEERKEFRQAAMLCRAAASACGSISSVVTQNQYLAHSKPLMSQFNSLLSAMSVTYDRLGAPHRLVPRTDRNLLAHHLAEMIDLIPTTRTHHTGSPRIHTIYLDRCNAFESPEEKESFVQRQFESR